ncbi:hypothetical protein [Mucilaginibacter sp. KACC 22063]|uniref:hypothetical protein n=1 Tax=Mucilaginibacter sp. KACC 22063 TaxID=3025666 RepID=UPI002366E22D|nr:hypothetical protein [Mucilaginibacter sp. KACC 22063]WDF55612.1 hypothetical protein PQ461_00885 [Mucilaginibacter sp. KACC 22063]
MERNSFWRLFTLFIVAVMTCFACNHREASRQQVDKNALLELIKQLSKTEGKNTSNASRDVLRDYAKRYELIVVDSIFKAADSSMVQVRVVHDKQFPHIDIQLPSQLERQLTFADFAQLFGTGVESPRPKEPIGFSVMYIASKVGDIRVMVQSHQPPDVPHPQIYQILIL